MKLERTLTYTYEIDDETLMYYLQNYNQEDWSFDSFVDWIDNNFYWEDFEEDIDAKWETVEDNFRINEKFLDEIEKLKNELEK